MPNDHYVPQFYLRNFGIPRKPAYVWSYIRNGSPREKAIKSVASIDDYPQGMGLGFLQADLLFPISPDRFLYMSNKTRKRALLKINREQMERVNQRIIYSAYKNVYSNIAPKDTQRIFDQTKEGDNTESAWS